MKITSIVILGTRWYDPKSGCTYSSAIIYLNGEVHKIIAPTVGYGSFYMQRAMDVLNPVLSIEPNPNKSFPPLWRWAKENGVTLIDEVFDVRRKRDLIR